MTYYINKIPLNIEANEYNFLVTTSTEIRRCARKVDNTGFGRANLELAQMQLGVLYGALQLLEIQGKINYEDGNAILTPLKELVERAN